MPNIDFSALDKLSPEEKAYALKIIQDMAKGNDNSFKDLLSADYKEIPVDIETFLHDPNYLGKGLITEEGRFTVFPYWVETLKKLFPTNLDTAYNTLVLSGAIGLGKSFIAVIALLYLLYRMLCLKNPYVYYGLQEIDHITFSFMNITMDAAKGVAWSKFQELVQLSPWFMAHGRVSKSINPEWQPIIDKGQIEIIYGSQPRHVIGRAVFCLDGNTVICTDKGDIAIKDLVDKSIKVKSMDEKGNIILSDNCTIAPTISTQDYYEIELEDGSVIKCTPNHKFMLKDGTYKEAQYLTKEDELYENKPFGYIYETVNNLDGKIYIGKRQKSKFDESYWGSGKYLKSAMNKYGKSNFDRTVIEWCYSEQELCEREKYWIKELNSQDSTIGYNLSAGGEGLSMPHTEEWKQKHSGSGNGRYGKEVSQETRDKISKANTGLNKGIKNPKKGRPGQKKPEGFSEKISKAQKGRIKSEQELINLKNAMQNVAEMNRGKIIYNNGVSEIRLKPNDVIPEGYSKGRLPKISEQGKNRSNLPKNYHWWNNGISEIYCASCPENYIPGRLKK